MSPSKASSHFFNYHYDDNSKKFKMQCKYCLKILVDGKNSTCKVYHLKSCRPSIKLTNKVKKKPNTFQVLFF